MTQTQYDVRHLQGEHDRFAHYVYDPHDPNALITKAMVEGTPLKALCGKVWVPTRDARNYPICPECKEIKENAQR